MQMLTDNPTIKDKFGFNIYSKILAQTIKDTNDLPFSIGIFGQWGSGKSSLMLMIEDQIKKLSKIKTIWFNPWKYDKKEELWSALIQSILYKIAEELKDDELGKKAKELAINAGWSLLKKGISTATGGFITATNIEDIKNALSKQDELYYKYINQFENDFEKVINKYTNDGKFVIFIDDLDRCLPENAITVLESLKLFIGNARCIFVLGMDHFIVEQGIRLRFGEKVNMSGRDYLDKIIQVPFYLPPVPFNKLKQALLVTKTANYNENIWLVIKYGLNGNPRKTKRFINSFYFAGQIIANSKNNAEAINITDEFVALSKDHQDFYLAQLLIFQMIFPDFYEFLKYNLNAWTFLSKSIVNAENVDRRAQSLDENEFLKKYWSNPDFKTFITKTDRSLNDSIPFPPNEKNCRIAN